METQAMKLSRRGFLAGALGALSTRILPAAIAEGKPRHWIWLNQPSWHRPIESAAYVMQMVGCRNDSQYFWCSAVVTDEEAEGITDLRPLFAAKAVQARMVLDSFLDPRCQCAPDFYCELHQSQNRAARYVGVDDGEESLSEPAVA
jgi:hypothetical protein